MPSILTMIWKIVQIGHLADGIDLPKDCEKQHFKKGPYYKRGPSILSKPWRSCLIILLLDGLSAQSFISFLVLGNYLTSTYISPDYNSPPIYWWGYCNLSILWYNIVLYFTKLKHVSFCRPMENYSKVVYQRWVKNNSWRCPRHSRQQRAESTHKIYTIYTARLVLAFVIESLMCPRLKALLLTGQTGCDKYHRSKISVQCNAQRIGRCKQWIRTRSQTACIEVVLSPRFHVR